MPVPWHRHSLPARLHSRYGSALRSRRTSLGQGFRVMEKSLIPCPPWSRQIAEQNVGHGNSIHTLTLPKQIRAARSRLPSRAAVCAGAVTIAGGRTYPGPFFPRLLYGRLICILDGFGLGFEWSVVGSFQRLTRSRDTCPIPTRITLLIGLAIEHCELCSDVDRRSPFTAGALGFDQWNLGE
jgi:hypothetical protein